MQPIYSLLPLLAGLVFLERTHLDGFLFVLFLAVVAAIGTTVYILSAYPPIRLSTHIEGRLRNFEDHFIWCYREIANRIYRRTSLEFWLLMHQGHVLPLVELGDLMAWLPQRHTDGFGGDLSRRYSYLDSSLHCLQFFLCVFV